MKKNLIRRSKYFHQIRKLAKNVRVFTENANKTRKKKERGNDEKRRDGPRREAAISSSSAFESLCAQNLLNFPPLNSFDKMAFLPRTLSAAAELGIILCMKSPGCREKSLFPISSSPKDGVYFITLRGRMSHKSIFLRYISEIVFENLSPKILKPSWN